MNSKGSGGIDIRKISVPRDVDKKSWLYTSVVFISNRKFSQRERGAPIAVYGSERDYAEDFSNKSGRFISIGAVCVAYPERRSVADQNYGSADNLESPVKSFTISRRMFFKSFSELQENVLDLSKRTPFFNGCPDQSAEMEAEPVLFIHGWLSTFSSAVMRAAQLKVDLRRKYIVVFSWPSDKSSMISSYDDAAVEQEISAKLIPSVMRQIKLSFGRFPSIIAHSMGARLYVDGITEGSSDAMVADQEGFLAQNTVLAAPDVSRSDFRNGFKLFRERNPNTTVYCTSDLALYFSKLKNGAARLGSCEPGQMAVEEWDTVEVNGKFYDKWRHSYFLSAPEMITDIANVISPIENVRERKQGTHPSRKLNLEDLRKTK